VHKLLSDQIVELGMQGCYEVMQSSIRSKVNETEFLFSGIKNAKNLKSFEGVDICWVEEAQVVSDESWRTLIPTIRKPGSEIWPVFNPEFDDDATFKRFVTDPPSDSRSAFVNYYDNPWFPETLRLEMEELKRKNYDQYCQVWEGECITNPEGAVYRKEWFPRHASLPIPPTRTMVVHSWDTAYKKGTHNDPSCCTIWHVTPSLYYLSDVVVKKMEFPELRTKALEIANRDKPDVILIEDRASGPSLIQELRAGTGYPVIAIDPEGDKETRARTTSAAIEGRRVSLPIDAPWLSAYEREMLLFPNGKHDDQVDSTSQFLKWINGRAGDSVARYEALLESF
jgi:PBSX family phage terminase large subunit